ncbi:MULTISPECIES: AbrB/MazE/SpoVT family DNA-binding domain-containing protein [Loigolactobacillus]|uniref:AbrB/MazE/SpoVT family DNA-binding domain-containing protein n=1 Tax=Loigolactobacillus TaxID=2767889 RepID=UPI000AD01616|nr:MULTISPECIES: hypothetical protein [Loigolactobacillus]MDA5388071.1 hypothetical protein [Loigolactobacillus backii]MDA5390544.1 hypothetical protein [Loigolactobacillus backii]
MKEYQVIVDAKGRIVIPVALRGILKMHPGQRVKIKNKKDKIVVKRKKVEE